MICYRLTADGDYAQQLRDGEPTGVWVNVQTNETYLQWLAEGNVPLPPEKPE